MFLELWNYSLKVFLKWHCDRLKKQHNLLTTTKKKETERDIFVKDIPSLPLNLESKEYISLKGKGTKDCFVPLLFARGR